MHPPHLWGKDSTSLKQQNELKQTYQMIKTSKWSPSYTPSHTLFRSIVKTRVITRDNKPHCAHSVPRRISIYKGNKLKLIFGASSTFILLSGTYQLRARLCTLWNREGECFPRPPHHNQKWFPWNLRKINLLYKKAITFSTANVVFTVAQKTFSRHTKQTCLSRVIVNERGDS